MTEQTDPLADVLAALDADAERAGKVEALAEAATEPLPEDARMYAYYYGFDRTGLGPVDAVLSAVAVAGKACHGTEFWTDEDSEWRPFDNRPGLAPVADSAADLIERTAQRSAATLGAVLAETPWLVERLRARDAAIRAALDLHAPNESCRVHDGGKPCCLGCNLIWPCETVAALASALGEVTVAGQLAEERGKP